jgi:hypothetical protein
MRVHPSLIRADHLLTATYPLVHDPKLLLGVLEHIHSYYVEVVAQLVKQQGMQPLATLRGQIEQLQVRQTLSTEQLRGIQRVMQLHEQHKQSPVTFRKQEHYVICDSNYGLAVLTEEKIKKELELAKHLHNYLQVTL